MIDFFLFMYMYFYFFFKPQRQKCKIGDIFPANFNRMKETKKNS